MKPLLLTMQAFGPFAEIETVDFSKLENKSLFLIHGNTGSGKTTILDAICFALYGESSGRDRDAYKMRSDFSDDSFQTEVTLTFLLGKDQYKIHRIPEQERAKLRGAGTTKRTAAATLWKIDSADNSETVIADRWSRVTEKIEELIGFRSDQFRQVVILPQGDFRRLLSANSQERQEILTTLFKTSRYKQFEDELKESAKRIKTQYDQLSMELKFHYQEAAVSSLDELDSLLVNISSDITSLSESYGRLRADEQYQLTKLSETKAINDRFTELDNSRTLFETLSAQKESFEERSTTVHLIEKALRHKGVLDYCSQLEKESTTANDQLSKITLYSSKILTDKEAAQNSLSTAQQNSSRRDTLLNELQHLKQLEPKLSAFDTAQRTIETIRKKLQTAATVRDTKKEHREKVVAALDKIQKELTEQREHALLLDTYKKSVTELEQFCTHMESADTLQCEQQKQRLYLQTSQAEYEAVLTDIEHCKLKLDNFEKVRERFQAASLAKNLCDNVPCPVCGSLSHPSPAVADEHIPDEKELLSLKKLLKKLETDRENHRNKTEQIQITLANCEKELSLINSALGSSPSKEISSIKRLLDEKRQLVKTATDASQRVEKLTADKSRGDTALVTTEKALEQALADFTNADAELLARETALQTLKTEIPAEFHSVQSVASRITEKETAIKQLDTALESARVAFDKINEQYIKISAECEQLHKVKNELETKAALSKSELIETITTDGFTSLDHFKSLLARADKLVSEQSQIQQYHLSIHTAEERFSRAQASCLNLSPADTSLYELRITEIQTQIDALSKKIAALKQRHEMLTSKHQSICTVNDSIKSLENQYGTAGRLHEIASGNNPQRMTFERFILAALLDEVLYAGTRRLKIMSRSRFELHRASEATDLRTSGGLDLQIFDSYTGTSRPVSSLSGGESFLAALSLALGLADIVQSHAGGIKLETIFIDEGFGSLDTEALDCALAALADLGLGGRLVGIISHVSELRERIDTRLEVLSGKNGSSTRIIA